MSRGEGKKHRYTLKRKMISLVAVAMLPLLGLLVYLLFSLRNYGNAYSTIVGNMTIANSYNLDFKEQMDESLYKLVVGYVTFDTIDADESVENPYVLLEDLREDFETLVTITTDKESKTWLQNLLRNLDTLQDRIDDIYVNLQEGDRYDDNIEMLDNNIYILTELIQDDIQYYIYYQTQSIELLREQLAGQLSRFVVLFLIVMAALVGTVMIIASLLVRSITKPMEELCEVTKQIAEGDFEVRVGITGNDEISDLAGSVNDMTKHLEIMVGQIKEDEKKMRNAELRLLQEQINPHFLYNALDTIVWLIEGGLNDKAVDMVVTLSNFFRLVLSHGRELITIRDEEKHVRSYLDIQRGRYHDIMDYRIEIDEEIYPYQILKLTLQPLVENALYHGIKNTRIKGRILISGHLENGVIVLTVADNGAGMDEETLARLRKDISRPCQKTEKGFGLANVNERIHMYFGSAYGMQIDSEEGEGTVVTLTIPALLSEEQEGKIV